MKRFEFSVEITKQLISVSTALIVGIAAFADSIFNNEANAWVFGLLFVLFTSNLISICAGIVHVGSIVNLVEKSEKNREEFVSVFDDNAPTGCKAQQLFFVIGLFSLVIALGMDKIVHDDTKVINQKIQKTYPHP
ncbi:MAG: hypothetical protein AAF478_12585 [Pseudomonadota bacterium]